MANRGIAFGSVQDALAALEQSVAHAPVPLGGAGARIVHVSVTRSVSSNNIDVTTWRDTSTQYSQGLPSESTTVDLELDWDDTIWPEMGMGYFPTSITDALGSQLSRDTLGIDFIHAGFRWQGSVRVDSVWLQVQASGATRVLITAVATEPLQLTNVDAPSSPSGRAIALDGVLTD